MIGAKDLARKLGISKSRLFQYVEKGRVIPPPTRVGNAAIFDDCARIVPAARPAGNPNWVKQK